MNPTFTLALQRGQLAPLRGLELLAPILRDAATTTPSLPVDGSMLEEIMRCPRASLFKHIFRRTTSRPKPELAFGTAIHLGLEMIAKGAVLEDALTIVEKFYEAHPMPDEDYRHFGRASEVLRGYVAEYPCEEWQIVETERPFSLTLGQVTGLFDAPSQMRTHEPRKPNEPTVIVRNIRHDEPLAITWEGKTDLLVHDKAGYWVMDHKTSKDFGEDSWEPYLAPNSSMLGYCWSVWRRTGLMPRGYIMDILVVRRPPKEGYKSKKLPNQYERRAFAVPESRIRAWEQNTMATIETWLTYAARGFYPQHDRKGYNCAWCEFRQNCQQPDDKMALTLLSSGDYQDYTWSPTQSA